MNVLVTGGSGLVGKYIVSALQQHGHTVGIADLVPPRDPQAEYHRVDVLDLESLISVVDGYECVVHCAGIPHPLNDPAETVFRVNVNGTFNVLEAAMRTSVRKVVFTSSESTLGFAFMKQRMVPDYVPIDELHPLRPQDPYGLSKVIGEQICRTASERTGIRTVCLRAPWIWVPEPEPIAFYRTLVEQYERWEKNLWTYVHVLDVADAHRRAVEIDLPSAHDVFFITAASNWTGRDSRELLHRFYPEIPHIHHTLTGSGPIISHAKAAALLGYVPHHTADELFRR